MKPADLTSPSQPSLQVYKSKPFPLNLSSTGLHLKKVHKNMTYMDAPRLAAIGAHQKLSNQLIPLSTPYNIQIPWGPGGERERTESAAPSELEKQWRARGVGSVEVYA